MGVAAFCLRHLRDVWRGGLEEPELGGFRYLVDGFKYLAPASYVIYISHHYLVVDATYRILSITKSLNTPLHPADDCVFLPPRGGDLQPDPQEADRVTALAATFKIKAYENRY